jgi:hypothetical protein
MSWKNKLIQTLTPKNTEEIKPNLFIQKYGDTLMTRLDKISKGHIKEVKWEKYRKITPACWNNKINWTVVILGANPIKSTLVFLFILFMAWSYVHDLNSTRDNVINIATNFTERTIYCNNYFDINNPISKLCNLGYDKVNQTINLSLVGIIK